MATATAPVLGALIGATGYAVGFGVAALAPLVATVITPVRAEAARATP